MRAVHGKVQPQPSTHSTLPSHPRQPLRPDLIPGQIKIRQRRASPQRVDELLSAGVLDVVLGNVEVPQRRER
eukprot:847301-Rhodomonas_salina.1